jgi:hypothetical protein
MIMAPMFLRALITHPLQTPEELAREPAAFPQRSTTQPFETGYPDWRGRLTRNLARRSDGRWEPLTHVHATDESAPTEKQ